MIIKAANGQGYESMILSLEHSCYVEDLDFAALTRHLPFLPGVIKNFDPAIRKVTKVRTVCDAMNSNTVYKQMLSEVHKVLRLYLTTPITTATSERSFSVLKRLLTYLRSAMTEKRLNNCMLLHVHKDKADDLDLLQVAKSFISVNSERQQYFGIFPD